MAKKAAKKAAKDKPAKKSKGSTKIKAPRQMTMLEDAAIGSLEKIAGRYADIRDQRIELNREEGSLKQLAKSEMHKHGKTHYKRNGIEITLIPGDEDIKVKIAKGDDGEGDE